MTEWVEFFQPKRDKMLRQLTELVEIESPSHDKAAVDRVGAWVEQQMRAAGADVQILPCQNGGDMVLGRWAANTDRRPILLMAHMDTVWPVGTLAARPVRQEGGRLFGPGAYDMKAGIMLALTALRGLAEQGRDLTAPVWFLCTGDEEVGSRESRATIEELAVESQLVLCLEPAMPGGAIKTGRKGVGGYTVRVTGRAAHAGGDHQKGINAIQEMAHQVLALQALTDYSQGTTVNVGTISGGSASNVVPATCEVQVDFRVESQVEADRLAEAVGALKPVLEGTTLHVRGGLNRPPLVRDEVMVRTFQRLQQLAGRHGIHLSEGSTGGGSDANFVAPLGVPVLDGLGADGDGAHAIYEQVNTENLAERAALLAIVFSEWA